jgi:glycosyltransferase involved in cell wall biosynthesis
MFEPSISVLIPAFNEETSISKVLQGIHQILKKGGFPYEIIVIDDGSTDHTAKIAKENGAMIISNSTNLGKGSALRAGFSKAIGKIIIMMDADGSHRPEDIPKLIFPIINRDSDVVMGTRFYGDSGRNSTKKLHLFGNRVFNILILLLTGKTVSDSQSGFRAFKQEVLRRIPLSSSRFEIESELTIKTLKNGFNTTEVPINCIKRAIGNSKLNSFQDGFYIFKAIIKASFTS